LDVLGVLIMHITLPHKADNLLRFLKLKILPKKLFFRTMLLIFVPLIVVQVVSIVAFFDGTWGRIGHRFANNLTSDMAMVMDIIGKSPDNLQDIQKIVETNLGMEVKVYNLEDKHKAVNKVIKKTNNEMVTGFLEKDLKRRFPADLTSVYWDKENSLLTVFIDTSNRLFEFVTSSKNIFSTSIFGFVAWMVGTSALLFLVAVLFLRIQVRSIADLAKVAEDFGKGIDNKDFKPYGSSEVRAAALAFIKMKERIQRQISERTQMLAGVSHDLRTPLTRMKLQATMLEGQDKEDMLQDIAEMEKMLEGYLSFVSGEGGEISTFVDMNELILSVLNKYRTKDAFIRYKTNDQVSAIQGREQALKRAITNVVSNALKYGKTVAVGLESNNRKLEVTIDDDGPGIPEDKREEVFKAFYRLEESRNKETGGIGLGLAITKDVITSHGGKIELLDSPLGGLRVLISIPL